MGDDGGPDPVGRGCATFYKTTGSVTNAGTPPDNDGDGQPDVTGCWPQGNWKFTLTADPSLTEGDLPACSPEPTPLASYEVKITYACLPAGADCSPTAPPTNAGDYEFKLDLVTATTMRSKLKYSSGAGGLCQGIFELFSDDGKEAWNMHPTLDAGGNLTGASEFARFTTDQWTN